MSDQELKGKKSGRGRGRNKLNATSYSSGVKDTEKSQQSAGSKKSGNKKKGSTTSTTTTKGLKVGRGRGRIRIEDSSSEEEPVIAPKEEPIDRLEIHKFPVTVKKELSSELEEKVSDENFINRVIKTDKLTFPEINHLSLIHTTSAPSYDLVDDIAPSLSFVGPRANIPLHNNKPLAWNHKVNLIGDKCPSPRIHICEKCERPILLYGRLIPCKHVFCYDCAKANPVCLRCTDKVLKVDKNKLGAVFMCTYENCRRTYLSHRDLQAHVLHRHLKRSANQQQSSSSSSKQSPQVASANLSNSLTVASPSTSIGSSSMKTNLFSSRNKTNPISGIDFSRVTSRATSSSIPLSFDDPTNDRKYSSYPNVHQQSSSSSSKTKLSGNKNLVMSGKSPNLTSPSLVNLPRCWPSSGQPSSSTISSASLSFTSPTLPQSLSTSSSWNSPLISDPRSSTTVNRHFYQ